MRTVLAMIQALPSAFYATPGRDTRGDGTGFMDEPA